MTINYRLLSAEDMPRRYDLELGDIVTLTDGKKYKIVFCYENAEKYGVVAV